MRRVFVTGATGFIGSYLVRDLLRRNYEVAVLVRPESDPWRIVDVLQKTRRVDWDGSSVDSFAESFREFAPDTVFHLGWSGVGNSHRNQLSQLTENVNIAIAMTQLSVQCGVQKFIGAGSQAEYGPVHCRIDENVLPRPTTLYGAAKLSVGILTERIAALGGVQHAWLRIFSIYGPKDNPHWMLPTLIDCLRRGERPALTLGEQMWDYLHVEDAARAFVSVAESGVGGVFNLGSGEARSLRTVIEIVRDLINPSLPLGFGEVPYRPDQVMRLHADIGRITSATGWLPQMPMTEGLARWIAESFAGSHHND